MAYLESREWQNLFKQAKGADGSGGGDQTVVVEMGIESYEYVSLFVLRMVMGPLRVYVALKAVFYLYS